MSGQPDKMAEKKCAAQFFSFFRLFLSFYTWFFSLMFIFRRWKKINLWNTAHNRYTNINNSKNTLKLPLQRTWIKEAKNIWIVSNWDLPLEVQIFNFCSHDCNLSLFFILCVYLFMVSNPTDCKLDIIMSPVFILRQYVLLFFLSSLIYAFLVCHMTRTVNMWCTSANKYLLRICHIGAVFALVWVDCILCGSVCYFVHYL